MITDTAALAANDDTNVKTLGEHVEEAAPQAPPADADPANPEPPPEIPSEREAQLMRENAALRDRLSCFEARRETEQHLLAKRDSNLHSIESAKNQVAAYKKELAETEAEIAALLRQPLPQAFAETPIGKAITAAETDGSTEPAPPVLGWTTVLPEVPPESVRLLVGVGDELPTVDAILAAELAPQAMEGEKRALKAAQTVTCYGAPWLVTKLWRDEEMGAMRANVVQLLTKDEWQQLHEEKYGRAVVDFDQSDEAKEQRQRGGAWCGLVVKVGRKAFVVGPQERAMHLAYDPPEAEPAAEPTATVETWQAVAARAQAIIEATGMTASAYALHYKLPQIALLKLLGDGEAPEDAAVASAIRDAFPPFEDDGDDDGGDEDGRDH